MSNRPSSMRIASALFSGAATLLLVLLIAYIAATGTFPTDGAMSFFASNWRLFPQHLLQTAPALTLSFVGSEESFSASHNTHDF